MKFAHWLAFAMIFFFFACQSAIHSTITIVDNNKTITFQTNERIPSAILKQAGITFHPNDRVLFNGLPIALDQPIPDYQFANSQITNPQSPNSQQTDSPITNLPITLQIRRAVAVLISSSQGQQIIQTSAFTVGEALQEANYQLHPGDKIDPPLNSPITNSPFTISYSPSHDLTITVGRKALQVRSSARMVGEALVEAGIPLIGLDYSLPAEKEALPSDGQIRVVPVSESVVLAQKPIPFENEIQASADVPLDQTQILQPGENGLNMQRIRIHYEDGEEISRLTEAETMVRPPKARILAYGTKIEVKTATVDGVKIEYWRAVQMYANSYSPCRSGVANCGSTTASGKALGKGMIAVRLSWYQGMRGQQFFIPGYGYGSIEDVCGGCVGKPWVDLGYSDNDYKQWNNWVTVYFLTPVPANVIYDLQ